MAALDEYLFPEKEKTAYNNYIGWNQNNDWCQRCESNPMWRDSESTLSSVDGYGVQKEGQEESKILKEIGTVEIKRVRGERRVCWRS